MAKVALLKVAELRWVTRTSLAIVFAVVSSAAANANTILATSPTAPFAYPVGVDQTLGYQFDVLDSGFEVTSLGFWDYGGDGLQNSHDIVIWASTGGVPLASATITAGTGAPLEEGFRWVSLLTPLNLSANTSYVIGATYVKEDQLDLAGTHAVIDPLFDVQHDALFGGPGLVFPNAAFSFHQGFFGPNLAGHSVPDGGFAAWLLGLGILGLVLHARFNT